MRLSYLHSERDNAPVCGEGSWEELSAALSAPRVAACTVATCEHAECKSKKGGTAWMPSYFAEGAVRKAENVEGVSVFVVDYDHLSTDEALAEALAPLRQFRAVVHSSHSDRPGDRCVRAVVALDRAVEGADWPRFWETVTTGLGLPADTQCRDGSRLYYLPSRPSDAPYHFESWDGPALSVPAVLAAADAAGRTRAAPRAQTERVDPLPFAGMPDMDDQEAAVRALAAAWPTKGRHVAQLALCGALIRLGWPDDQVTDFVTAVCALAAQESGVGALDGDPYKRGQSVRATRQGVELGRDVTGWPALREAMGPLGSAVSKAMRRLGAEVVEPDPGFTEALRRAAPPPVPSGGMLGGFSSIKPPEEVEEQEPAETRDWSLRGALLAQRPAVRTYATGFQEFDRLTGGGIATRQLTVISAPPADGKSALVVDWAIRIEPWCPVLYVSTELESQEIAARAAANIQGCMWRDAVRGRIPGDMLARSMADDGRERRIWTIGCESLPPVLEEAGKLIGNVANEMLKHFKIPPVIVLDYMQDLARGGDASGLRSRVGEVAMHMRAMSQAGDCAVVAVSSVSRTYYGAAKQASLRESTDPRVYLAAMKESGDVDYAAATAIFLDVDQAEEGSNTRAGRIAISKCRHGDAGFVGVRFEGATGRWSPDDGALEALKAENKKAAHNEHRESEDEHAVLTKLAQIVKRSGSALHSDLVGTAGIQQQRARDAISRMRADGRIVTAGSVGAFDPNTGRKYPAAHYVVGGERQAPPELPPIDPTTVAAGFLSKSTNPVLKEHQS